MTSIKPWLFLAALTTAFILPVQSGFALERAPDNETHYYPRMNVPTSSGNSNPSGRSSGSWGQNHSDHWVSGPNWHHRSGGWRYPGGYWRGRWGYWGGWRGYWGPPPRYYWGSSCWDCGIGSALIGLTFGGIAPPVMFNSTPPPPLPAPIERNPYDGCKSITVKGIDYYNCEGRDNPRRDYNPRYQDDVYPDRADNGYQGGYQGGYQDDAYPDQASEEAYQGRSYQRYGEESDQDRFENGEAAYRYAPLSRTPLYDSNGWEAK